MDAMLDELTAELWDTARWQLERREREGAPVSDLRARYDAGERTEALWMEIIGC